jgi:hypothetical protein
MRARERELQKLEQEISDLEKEHVHQSALYTGAGDLVQTLFEFFGLPLEEAGSMKNAAFWWNQRLLNATDVILPGGAEMIERQEARLNELYDKQALMKESRPKRA